MSAIHLILCTLEPRELHELEQACIGAVEKYLDEHPDCEDDWGEMGSGGPVPSEDDVRAAYAKSGLEPDADLSARLARCRTTFRIDHPGDIEVEGGLQVSILVFLLERAGDGLVLWNDYPLERSEDLLEKLRTRPGAEGFGVKSRAKRRAPARRDPKDGEFRGSRMLRLLERAVNDVRVAIDVKQALHSVSELARNYGALLLEEGAVTDTKAAKALEISQAEVVTAAEELERALFRR